MSSIKGKRNVKQITRSVELLKFESAGLEFLGFLGPWMDCGTRGHKLTSFQFLERQSRQQTTLLITFVPSIIGLWRCHTLRLQILDECFSNWWVLIGFIYRTITHIQHLARCCCNRSFAPFGLFRAGKIGNGLSRRSTIHIISFFITRIIRLQILLILGILTERSRRRDVQVFEGTQDLKKEFWIRCSCSTCWIFKTWLEEMLAYVQNSFWNIFSKAK